MCKYETCFKKFHPSSVQSISKCDEYEWLGKYYACINEALFQKLIVLLKICQYYEKMCLLKFQWRENTKVNLIFSSMGKTGRKMGKMEKTCVQIR